MSSQGSALRLFDLIQSHRVTAVIHVAVKLGLAELLRGGPQPLGELARATGADQAALGRLLTALSTIGICRRTDDDSYALTEVGAGLDGDAEQSFKAWAIFEAEMLSPRWSGLLESVMTGKTAAELQGFASSFELMGRTPEHVDKFNAAMTELTRLVTPDILRSYDFSGISHLMDVGGGSGELLGRHRAAKSETARNRFRPSEMRRRSRKTSSADRHQRSRRICRRRFLQVDSGARGCDHPQERDP